MKTTHSLSFPRISLFFAVLFLCSSTPTPAGGLVAVWGDNSYGVSGQTRLPNGLNNVKAIATGWGHSLALKADGTVVAWGYLNYGPKYVPAGLSNVTAIAAGNRFNLALKADGTVFAWGGALCGETDVPAGLSNVTAIAAGEFHSLALKADGTVVAWGCDPEVRTNVPPGLSNVIAVAAGGAHNLALKSDGTVYAWGENSSGQTDVPVGLSNVIKIAANASHNLALKSDGTLVAWGNNDDGQTNIPPGVSNVIAIATGWQHSLALKSDGTVVAWGDNSRGQTTLPPGLSNVTAIAAAVYLNLALMPEGPVQILQNPQNQEAGFSSNVTFTVAATGREPLYYQWFRYGGALTDGGTVSGATTASLTISNLHLANTGTYSVVVSNAFGSVLSSNAVLTMISPPFITSQSPSNQIVRAGTDVSLSVTVEGTEPLSYQWFRDQTNLVGSNYRSYGLSNAQAGGPHHYSVIVTNIYGAARADFLVTITNSQPYILRQPYVRLPNQDTATNGVVPIGGSITIYSDARGSLPLSYQWRFNGVAIPSATNKTLDLPSLRVDQAGYYNVEVSNAFGATNSAKFFLNVVQVLAWGVPFNGNTNIPVGLTNGISVAAGGSHITALRADGTVKTWQANAGYVFNTSPAITNVPASATNVVAVAAGRDHSLALRANGTVVAWGVSTYGLTNVPAGLSNVVAIGAGSYRSFAVRSNGTVVGWGASSTVPAGLSNVVAVAAGDQNNLALKQDGTVLAWGSGAINIPANLSNVLAIAASSSHGLALKADGRVVGWSAYTSSATNVPLSLSNAVAIAAGAGYSLALRADGTVVEWGTGVGRNPTTTELSNVVAIAAGGVQSPFSAAVIGTGSPVFTIQPSSQVITKGANVQLHARAAGIQPIMYQWQLENQNLSSATNSSLLITNAQGKDTGRYRVLVINALGAATSSPATLSMPFATNLAAALNAPQLIWSSSPSNAPWFAQIQETHDGDTAAQSGRITHGQQVILQTTVFGPGTLTFWWKVSSEEGYDRLWFNVDVMSSIHAISGETDWQQVVMPIPAGSHVVRWVYSKDATVSAGQDAGWVDEVVYTPASPLVLTAPRLLPDGSFAFDSSDPGGRILSPANLALIEVQASTNLRDWVTLTGGCTLTNGVLLFRDPDGTDHPSRFYRIVEH